MKQKIEPEECNQRGCFTSWLLGKIVSITVVGLFSTTIFFSSSICIAEEKLVAGMPLPLSGDAASFGKAIQNGIILALEDGARQKVSVVFEDDQYISSKTVSAARKLIEADHAAVLLSVGSTPSHALAPVTDGLGIPLFAWASDATVAQNKKFVIRTYPSSTEEGAAIANEAVRRRYKNVALLYSQNDYTKAVFSAVQNILSERAVFSEELPPKVTDFTPSILKAIKSNAEAFFVCFTPGNAGLFAKQLRALHRTAPIFGCEALNDDSEVAIAQGGLHNAWFVTNQVSPEFEKRYEERFHEKNLISAAALHYDIIKTLDRIWNGSSPKDLVQKFLSLPSQQGAIPEWQPMQSPDDKFIRFQFDVRTVD